MPSVAITSLPGQVARADRKTVGSHCLCLIVVSLWASYSSFQSLNCLMSKMGITILNTKGCFYELNEIVYLKHPAHNGYYEMLRHRECADGPLWREEGPGRSSS